MASLLRTSGLATAGDVRLRQRVILQFLEEHLPHPIRIDVSVHCGVVTLFGELDNDAQQLSAEAAVQRVAGARGVVVYWALRRPGEGAALAPVLPPAMADRPVSVASAAVDVPAWWLEARAKVLCDEIDHQARDAPARHRRDQASPAYPV